MIRWLKKFWCWHLGHPYQTITVPIVAYRPMEEPEHYETYCTNCGTLLMREWTDNAGTERRTY